MIRYTIAAALLSLSLTGCASGRFGPAADTEVPKGPHTLKKLSVEERHQVMQRARVWQAIDTSSLDLIKGPALPADLRIGAETACTFVFPDKPLSGMTPKFLCALDKDDQAKVKYGEKNGEVYAEVAASRLLWALGFKADVMVPTHVTCRNCPADPFAASAIDWPRGSPSSVATRVFDPAIIEREITGNSVEVPGYEGWAWPELDQIRPREGAATRAQIDAFKLLAVFIQHSDSKPGQQEIVCAERRNRKDAKGNETCDAAWLVIKDLGGSFGKATRFNTSKMTLADWAGAGVWKDGQTCVGDLPRSLTGRFATCSRCRRSRSAAKRSKVRTGASGKSLSMTGCACSSGSVPRSCPRAARWMIGAWPQSSVRNRRHLPVPAQRVRQPHLPR